MNGLLTVENDIKTLQKEYQLYASYNFDPELISKIKIETAELVLEECEL